MTNIAYKSIREMIIEEANYIYRRYILNEELEDKEISYIPLMIFGEVNKNGRQYSPNNKNKISFNYIDEFPMFVTFLPDIADFAKNIPNHEFRLYEVKPEFPKVSIPGSHRYKELFDSFESNKNHRKSLGKRR